MPRLWLAQPHLRCTYTEIRPARAESRPTCTVSRPTFSTEYMIGQKHRAWSASSSQRAGAALSSGRPRVDEVSPLSGRKKGNERMFLEKKRKNEKNNNENACLIVQKMPGQSFALTTPMHLTCKHTESSGDIHLAILS